MNSNLWLYEITLAFRSGDALYTKPWILGRSVAEATKKGLRWAKKNYSYRLKVVSVHRKGSIEG